MQHISPEKKSSKLLYILSRNLFRKNRWHATVSNPPVSASCNCSPRKKSIYYLSTINKHVTIKLLETLEVVI